mmetsp:Transcript_65970/g.116823  ORF Transcript_65970/g.116823 Transcript_65970/m.116823 type:complete len:115 (+) Transcript_65970:50-394(+)|eukprot:CAMPEP_0197659728 /NCGR_PEP_ID=MMETSP1338-20131121/48824_1 /TAXON_ID=43686 ORGANISM="Pelagodinium beii, Strain RCC1491" /NCGR_SAMPLE_ID=MMETSP1338 /ASSEMBLY_ACC=CAM_ASM_000754 /LENGTH=114 /DNA_ID=CAMNT_0043236783 /DNA_START=43 /DNA_END=387 /DNA_ORIENTATION=-
MGNCQMVSEEQHGDISHEALTDAVEEMEAEDVEKCLAGGMPVNGPIDNHGHTILDKHTMEHAQMIEVALQFKGSSKDATSHFYAMEEAAFQTLKILREHGAVLSAQTAVAKRGI